MDLAQDLPSNLIGITVWVKTVLFRHESLGGTWVQFGSITCRIPCTIVLQGAGPSKTNHQHSILVLVSGTSTLVFQDKDLEFFIDQRFRAAPCLSTEFLKSWFCNELRFCALHRTARELLPDPERERASRLREIL